MSDIVLRVEGIKKTFRGDLSRAKREVLHGVSLHARAGEILGFLGPNGAGKTTTIKIVLGLIRPDEGSVAIFDNPAGTLGAMARVGYLPETPYFYPHLSLEEFLVLCGRMSGIARVELASRIGSVIELVGLAEHRKRRLKAYSKGMLQRAGLAQAILHEPDLFVFDEPFSGLDPLGRKLVRDCMVDLKRRGKTIFFSSHILPDMESLCDRTAIIREGRIVKTVGMDDLIRMGEGRVEIIARGVRAEGLESIADYVESSRTAQDETFIVVKKQKYVRTVIQHLYNSGGEVLRVAGLGLSLERIFLDEIARGDAPGAPAAREDKSVFAGF